MNSFNETWEYVCSYCKENIAEVAYKIWIERIVPDKMDFDRQTVILNVPNEFHKNIIEKNYRPLLSEAFEQIFGFPVSIELQIADTAAPAENSASAPAETDNEYTFETFVVGPTNSFACAAAKAVAENPGTLNNPFLIYGNSGLGKTHLLNAIRHKIVENFPNIKNVVYVRSDEFTNELVEAMLIEKNTSAFHQKYRNADLFLMDDIQFIAGKESTQEEFFHTFDALKEANKQIVLTSDRPPKDMKVLEERIRSRIESGFMVDIQPPDFETRLAIINKKVESLHFEVPQNVKEYIANRIKSNIRQIEGCIKKLHAYYLLEGKAPTIALTQTAISDIISNDQPTPVTIEKILEEVSRTYGVTTEDIRSQSHKAQISNARQIAIYVIREITQLTYEAIGKEFGGKNHATIVYSLQQAEKRIEQDPRTKATVEDIIKNIRNM